MEKIVMKKTVKSTIVTMKMNNKAKRLKREDMYIKLYGRIKSIKQV